MFRVFIGTLCLTAHVVNLWSAASPEVKWVLHGSKSSAINHTVKLSDGQGSPGKEFLTGVTSQGPSVQLPQYVTLFPYLTLTHAQDFWSHIIFIVMISFTPKLSWDSNYYFSS